MTYSEQLRHTDDKHEIDINGDGLCDTYIFNHSLCSSPNTKIVLLYRYVYFPVSWNRVPFSFAVFMQ